MKQPRHLGGQDAAEKQRKAVAIISVALVMLVVFILGWLIGPPLIRAIRNKEDFTAWINQQGFLKYFIMCGLMILQIIIAIIPGGPIEVAAGYAFGPAVGTMVCVIGSLLGSALVFFLARRYGMKLVRIFVPQEKLKASRLLNSKRGMHLALFFVFLVPGTPKDILTYLGGLTGIRMSAFLIITSIARFPAILMATMGGHSVSMKNYRALALIVLATVVLGGLLAYLYRRHTRSLPHEEEEDDPLV